MTAQFFQIVMFHSFNDSGSYTILLNAAALLLLLVVIEFRMGVFMVIMLWMYWMVIEPFVH